MSETKLHALDPALGGRRADCDHVDCGKLADWMLEVCPMPSDGVSVVYACTQHVGDLSDGITEARGLGGES